MEAIIGDSEFSKLTSRPYRAPGRLPMGGRGSRASRSRGELNGIAVYYGISPSLHINRQALEGHQRATISITIF